MAVQQQSVTQVCAAAKAASRELAATTRDQRDAAVEALRATVAGHADELLRAAAADADRQGSRMQLSTGKLEGVEEFCRHVTRLPDPIGQVLGGWQLPNGLAVEQRRVPLGVIAYAFRGRPVAALECVALCLKSANAVVLHGSEETAVTNDLLALLAAEAAASAGLPAGTVSHVPGADDATLRDLVRQRGVVDLVKQRGGTSLEGELAEIATVPVYYAVRSNNHIYVDASADVEQALEIVVDAKVRRPGMCNAVEKVLVHAAVAERFLPAALTTLSGAGVELHVDARARAYADAAGVEVRDAEAEEWRAEYLALVLGVKVVDSCAEAIAHVNEFGSGHSEGIVTDSLSAADGYAAKVDAACVYVNASTRFTDGEDLGLGPELGNSTQKLHARGPMTLGALCTTRYVMRGDGQVRG